MTTSFITTSQSSVNLLSEQGPETLRNAPTLLGYPTLPSIIGYEVLEEIGRGGMGVVYKARDLQLKRSVAIKMLLDPEFASAEQRMRFKIEAEAVAQLRHPNIVQVYELGELAGTIAHPYMVLEFIEGPTLFRYIRQQRLSERESAALLITLARAVQHAHDHGLIHRDLKPANILLQTDVTAESSTQEIHRLLNYMPKITDFGLVKALVFEGDAKRDLTRPELMVGTPQYMAPEQANPTAQAVSCSVDIYSLGVILYELLTGQLPYDDKDVLKMLMDVQTKEPVPPRKLQPRLSLDLETICLKCLQKSPEHRYQSAAMLAEDLTRFLNHEPIHARPLSEWQRMAKWVQRYPTIASLAAILFSVVTIGLVVIAFLWRQADTDRQQAVAKSRDAEIARDVARTAEQGARDSEQSARKLEVTARRSLYYSRIAQADLMLKQGSIDRPMVLLNSVLNKNELEDPRGWEWYYLRQQCNPMVSLINTPNDYVRKIAFHPTKECFFCIECPENFDNKKPEDFPSRLMMFTPPSDGGKWTSRVIYDAPMPLREMHLALEGTKILLTDLDKRSVVVDVGLSPKPLQASEVVQLPSERHLCVAGEAGIVVMWQQTSKLLELYDLREERVSRTIELPSEPLSISISTDGKRVAYVLKSMAAGVWNVEKQQPFWQKHVASGEWKLAMDDKGTMLALLHDKTHAWQWLAGETGRILQQGQHPTINELLFSRDGKRLALLAAAFQGNEVQVWRSQEDGTIDSLPLILRGHQGKINGMTFHPDGKKLISYGADGSLRLWDTTDHPMKGGLLLQIYRGHNGNVLSADFDPRNNRVLSGGLDANILVWNTDHSVERDQLSPDLGCGGEWISGYSFIAGTNLLAIFEHKNTNLFHYDLIARKVIRKFKLEGVNNNFAAPRYDLSFTSDGKRLALTNGTRDQAMIFDTVTGELLWKTPTQAMRVLQVHFSGDGKRFLLAGHFPDPGKVPPRAKPFTCGYQVWDMESRQLVQDATLPAYFTGMNINQDGTRVAAVLRHPANKFSLHVFQVNESGKELFRASTTATRMMHLAFSPDGKWIAGGNFDPEKNYVLLWSAETGKKIWQKYSVVESTHVAFTRDSRRLFNTGYTSDAILFDVRSGNTLISLKNHGTPRVNDYALSPRIVMNQDETMLAIHSWDAGISLFHAFNPDEYNRNPTKFDQISQDKLPTDVNDVVPNTP